MPSAPLLPFDDLLAPIPSDKLAGGTIPFTVRQKLEEYRKEIDPAALADRRSLAQQILQRKGHAPVAAPNPPPPRRRPRSPPNGYARPLHTRDDVYRQLAEAAELLRQTEPHSPIPYLIQRAVALGRCRSHC